MSPSLRRLPHVASGGFIVVLATLCCPLPLFSAPLPDLAADVEYGRIIKNRKIG